MNNGKIYFKFFNSRSLPPDFIEIGKDKTLFSTYPSTIYKYKLWSKYGAQKEIVKEILRLNIDIKMDDYILCPLYGNEKVFTDFQFGATETRKIGENEIDNLKRCLSEELGLKYQGSSDLKSTSFEVKYKSNYIKIFILNINRGDLKPNLESAEENKFSDDKRADKTGCVVYGPENDILNFLKRDEIIRDKSTDPLVGIVGINFRECIKYFKK